MPDDERSWLARRDARDLVTGLLLSAAAAFFAVTALRRLSLGTPANMGPGFFPLMVSAGLAGVGVTLAVRGLRGSASAVGTAAPPRAFFCILGAPAIFALAIAPLGFVPAIALATFVAAWSSRLMTVRFAALLTAALTALCTILFVWMLKMPVRLFGWPGA